METLRGEKKKTSSLSGKLFIPDALCVFTERQIYKHSRRALSQDEILSATFGNDILAIAGYM